MGGGVNGRGEGREHSDGQQLSLGLTDRRIPWEIIGVKARYPETSTIGWYASSWGPVWYALVHGDGIELLRGLPDRSVDQIATDIPYGEVNRATNGLRNLNRGSADVLTFSLETFVDSSVRPLRGSLYVFCGSRQVSDLTRALDRQHLVSLRTCAWEKSNPSPLNAQCNWLSALEFCVFAKRPGAGFYAPMGKNLWTFPTVRGKKRIHPTQKPQALMQYLIQASSRTGQLVVDPCFGSGSTAEAAITLGRHFIGAELDEAEYDKAVRRIRDLPPCQSPEELPPEYRDLLT